MEYCVTLNAIPGIFRVLEFFYNISAEKLSNTKNKLCD